MVSLSLLEPKAPEDVFPDDPKLSLSSRELPYVFDESSPRVELPYEVSLSLDELYAPDDLFPELRSLSLLL